MMTNTTMKGSLLACLLAAAAFAGGPQVAEAQPQPASLTIAVYAPSAAFSDAAARLAYVQGLAKAVQTKTGIPTTGKAFGRYEDLKKADPDFAIVEGLCVTARRPGQLLAVAAIGGATSQPYALFSRGGVTLGTLKGKKLAYVKTGCNDMGFVENAMFDGEVRKEYFGGLVDRPDVAGAVAAVKDYKAADVVFAPAGQGKGLTKMFDAGAVPTPAFVAMKTSLPAPLVDKVREAVLGYGAGGGIDGWRAASQAGYDSLSGRMGARVKRPVFATPDPVRLEEEDVLLLPKSVPEQATVKQHFWEPTRGKR